MLVSVLTGGSPPPEPEIWGKMKEIDKITAPFYCCNICYNRQQHSKSGVLEYLLCKFTPMYFQSETDVGC